MGGDQPRLHEVMGIFACLREGGVYSRPCLSRLPASAFPRAAQSRRPNRAGPHPHPARRRAPWPRAFWRQTKTAPPRDHAPAVAVPEPASGRATREGRLAGGMAGKRVSRGEAGGATNGGQVRGGSPGGGGVGSGGEAGRSGAGGRGRAAARAGQSPAWARTSSTNRLVRASWASAGTAVSVSGSRMRKLPSTGIGWDGCQSKKRAEGAAAGSHAIIS